MGQQLIPNNCFYVTIPTVPGNTYYIMIDGFEGGTCDYFLTFSDGIVLPVELTSFTGVAQEKGNLLTWATASEKNNDYFEIEATADGIHYETLGKVNGAGNSTTENKYSYLDRNPKKEVMYYRLKQTDFDGETETHKTISIKRDFTKKIKAYPNPSNGDFEVSFDSETEGKFTFSIASNDGRKAIQKEISTHTGKNTWNFSLENELTKGFYYLQIQNESGVVIGVEKMVVN